MATRSVATVFGGSGFIGRYVVKRLARQGYLVRVAVRDTESALFCKPMGSVGQVVLLHAPITDEGDVRCAVDGADVVVNAVGILAETGGATFQSSHVEGAGRVARLAAAAGASRMVHISALGADPGSPSVYGKTKADGEAAVWQAFPSATILRPSVVFGPEDHFFNRFAGLGRMLPFMPVVAGDTRMQPVYVSDVADAVMAALARPDAAGKIFELGGPRVWTFREILQYILHVMRRRRRLVEIPMGMARLEAGLLEMLPWKPVTRDQLLMLSRDNVVGAGMPGLTELGITPTPAELVVPGYLRRFQPGGGRRPALTLAMVEQAESPR